MRALEFRGEIKKKVLTGSDIKSVIFSKIYQAALNEFLRLLENEVWRAFAISHLNQVSVYKKNICYLIASTKYKYFVHQHESGILLAQTQSHIASDRTQTDWFE